MSGYIGVVVHVIIVKFTVLRNLSVTNVVQVIWNIYCSTRCFSSSVLFLRTVAVSGTLLSSLVIVRRTSILGGLMICVIIIVYIIQIIAMMIIIIVALLRYLST